jgi:hypothetical protein
MRAALILRPVAGIGRGLKSQVEGALGSHHAENPSPNRYLTLIDLMPMPGKTPERSDLLPITT